MTETTVTPLIQPGEFCDQLTSVLRSGAQALLTQAIEAEVASFMACHAQEQLEDGRARLVRHGHLPEREIQTGIGAVKIRQPRVRDRAGKTRDRLLFLPTVAPKYMRRSKSLDALIPWLYLKGVSSGDFQAALSALLGADAPNLSGDTVLRLRKVWQGELSAFEKRDLSARNYVYIWADGVYFQAPMEQESQCMLVIIGATPEGKKELVGFTDGYRESMQSWSELLLDLKARGLKAPPKLAVGDGALGFWAALRKIFPQTKEQRCWVHKTANILNKMPKALQAKAKADLHQIWMADSKADAGKAFNLFCAKYELKYDKAVACLTKDRDALLAFYDFPAEHWKHIRTTNPIESTFATVRHRTRRTKGCLKRNTAKVMVFKLIKEAEKRWLRLRGKNQLPKVIQGIIFKDGIEIIETQNKNAA
ncbi:MAG: IS256 family transposase [Rhodobacteraceae bacterium]|nr:IS256 family transposase [Paracoccaceae bacterium]MBL4873538.1 IS256 family transposase [Paracoccaceae bacterium]MBL4873651.1 IS256 family transposase [Paracoccaceae bacterium]MBL4874285.1 IS256 family transposase [Paracoccaceae bacterium]MBL4874297.1 IS256 family transposase [Paracoccaceae bacterium]